MPGKRKDSPPSSKEEPKTPSQPEARIHIEGSDNVIVTASKAIAANIRVVFEGNWRPFAVVLTFVAFLLAAILWFVVPKSACQFDREFTVGVAEFVVLDEDGKEIRSSLGRDLADTITSQISSYYKEMRLDTVVGYEICGPEQIGVIQTEGQARSFAHSTGATIVVYGSIRQSNGLSFFSPRFFVNHSAFKEAEEITGQHELGEDVQGNFSTPIMLITSPGVQARVEGLSMLTIGLVYYSVDRLDEALQYFKEADKDAWIGSGKETVYLLTGNVYIRQASKTKDFSDLSTAEKYYQDALDIDPDYGRAMIGQANVYYLRALKLNDCNPTGLEAASALLEQALSLEDQPASASIETKVHFYRGQIALIRDACQLSEDDWLSVAQREFNWVVDRYESDPGSDVPQSIQYLASHAYARLGWLAYRRNDAESAISYLNQAITIASPTYQGEYSALLGDVYAAVEQTENAIASYQRAIVIAESNGEAESVKKYQDKLDSILEQ